MMQMILAIFRDGAFVPTTRCNLPDNSRVELIVGSPSLTPPAIADADQRRRKLLEITQWMTENPLPAGTPAFRRSDKHEHR